MWNARPRDTAAQVAALGRRLWADDRGQDLVEYALATAGLGLVSIATWPAIATALGAAYQALDQGTQGLWQPPGPGGAP